jgi:hypothetical protein
VITLYGAAPFPESPRIPDTEPFQPFVPYDPAPPTFTPPTATPRGEAIDKILTTDETLIAVEQHCMAMVRFLTLPSDQRAAVERYLEAARRLVGRVQLDSEIYQVAQRIAEGLRSHPSRDLHKAEAGK